MAPRSYSVSFWIPLRHLSALSLLYIWPSKVPQNFCSGSSPPSTSVLSSPSSTLLPRAPAHCPQCSYTISLPSAPVQCTLLHWVVLISADSRLEWHWRMPTDAPFRKIPTFWKKLVIMRRFSPTGVRVEQIHLALESVHCSFLVFPVPQGLLVTRWAQHSHLGSVFSSAGTNVCLRLDYWLARATVSYSNTCV